ncbi:MAG TPA: tetratricopeptide repeat protein [Aquabacterium sp.]|uniref:tetratricopeptide repeat protein n=1 Tax=Aquabacterium sp. TaxID=1872578 RepID=UPI002E361A16|nr:tetratricopeptide repeat protein [Aquabacterium sp.]HEX5356570.1 tetratricopeptide repeat protein [Aquabacterium sp.]
MSLKFAHLPGSTPQTAAASSNYPGPLKPLARWLSAGMFALSALGSAQAADEEGKAPASAPAAVSATPESKAKPPVQNSAMDATQFFQLFVAEYLFQRGDLNSAYQAYLESARQHKDGQLYQRAVEIGRAISPELGLTAAKAWRQALPQSRQASEYTADILLSMGRSADLAAPLRSVIQLTPTLQQPQLMLSLPRIMTRLQDRNAAAQVIDDATQPWRQPPLEMAEAWSASAEGWLQARDVNKSTAALNKALALRPNLMNAGLVAIGLMDLNPQAEAIVKQQLARPDAAPVVRLAYGRRLAGFQRLEEAAQQLELLLKEHPEQNGSWITLAAVRMELKQVDKAEAALKHVLDRIKKDDKAGTDTPANTAPDANEIDQAYLYMAQVAEQRNDLAQAQSWLERADPKNERVNIQIQRARLLARQNKVPEARKLIHDLPETEPRDAVVKYQAEAQVLRDAHQPEEAYKVLGEATKRFPDDSDLVYDQAMLAEKLQMFAEAESLLRKTMEMAPDNPNAFNALGYSLADRGVRLDEARQLIKKALELRPADPFIVDSMGWVEFRAGNLSEAVRLLTSAYQTRPDAEIAAHLGEVLWAQGQKDEARKVWQDASKREPDNDTLKETLKRFQGKL